MLSPLARLMPPRAKGYGVMSDAKQEDMLEKLKALADESRLLVLRLLNEREYSVGELAAKVELTEATVSHHLAKLRNAGLVTLRMAGNQRFYRVNTGELNRFKQMITTIEILPPPIETIIAYDNDWIEALDWSDEDKNVLREYTLNRELTHLPTKQKKLLVIIRWLATLFQPDALYTEPEVNAIIKAAYAKDYVGLRRDLVDLGYLRRERGGGKYWLAPLDEPKP